ncbi:MAG: formate dehydrogenase accessory sulfurtransferase FdhD [Myxococcota bacterium]|nr:formate dehydrogenase accessory sulfurtransferase FdhD [Myxococcota bacterium]
MSELGSDQAIRMQVTRIFPERREERMDPVVVEAPLELRFGDEAWMTTMRTPGDDLDLALGLLFSEGVISSVDQVVRLAHCPKADPPESLVRIVLTKGCSLPRRRAVFASSSCGVCGSQGIQDLRRRFACREQIVSLPEEVLMKVTTSLAPMQKIFQITGALHGAALLDGGGEVLVAAEDVGRHNAVDKVIGKALRQNVLMANRRILAVTSRVGFEIAAKAWAAQVEALVAVGAPSDLAIKTCAEAGIQLAGFATGERLNLYTF